MKKLKVLFLSMVLILGLGSGAMAATSAIQNLPGGAGIMQWMAATDGTHTLLNIQNTLDVCGPDGAAIMVHITFYDRNSDHLFDVRWPMTPRDNLGIAVTGDGTNVNLLFEPGEADETPHTFASAGIGDDSLQLGYATVTITGWDAGAVCYTTFPAGAFQYIIGNGDGDPSNDTDFTGMNRDVVLPDYLFARAAIMFPDSVLGINGVMLQGFQNMAALDENLGVQFVGIAGADAICGLNVNWDNDASAVEITPMTDVNGVDVHTPELYMTVNWADLGTAAMGDIAINLAPAACNRGGRAKALGSGNNAYWARYNVTPGFTDTNLVLVYPANSATGYNPASLIADARTFTALVFDDDENVISTPQLTGPEVVIAPFVSSTNPPFPGMPQIQHTVYEHGEILLTTAAPVYGYVYTTVSNVGSDIYPLIPEFVPVMIANIVGGDVDAVVGPVGGDIITLP